MSFSVPPSVIATGVLTGLVYGLGALGLSVIFGVVRVVNFAHGEIMVLGMYGAALFAQHAGLDPLAAAPLVAAVLFAGGWALQRGLINRLIGRPEHMQFILLAGVAMMLVNLMLMLFGPEAQAVQVAYAFDSFELGPLVLDKVRVYAALAAVLVAGGLSLFFSRTRLGKTIRACADNQLGARVVGLDVPRLYALTFGIGSATAGIAGCLLTLMVDVRPLLAPELTLLGFIIVIVGGLGSLTGALLGGLLIGVSEAFAGFLLLPSMKSMFSYGLLILILLLRPQGLLGKSS
jgi:branched-chain amino acid transport system permease protein